MHASSFTLLARLRVCFIVLIEGIRQPNGVNTPSPGLMKMPQGDFASDLGAVSTEALNASNVVLGMDLSAGHSGVMRGSFGGIRILSKEFGSLGMFCDVAVHMNGAL